MNFKNKGKKKQQLNVPYKNKSKNIEQMEIEMDSTPTIKKPEQLKQEPSVPIG